ncbi:6-pyruvoyl tetrahydrobiopterin synthase-like isoform X2 [Dreissena polymorpha]|uniref:6-pyruvoyltetrahydropterin synthase n=1 Tax=Dreissena polymorpha TaxID=45954 RepID=A0A9D4MZ17_DREPO|nr:6-pyruvoyl tetrahydrobiopterin synthase-like isoform X2 [Dreissena polymorpha]KAH3884334.1 hypothetical protein DPMN_008313 [Dreissena polymorpha]
MDVNMTVNKGEMSDGKRSPVVYIQRTETFSACHRLHSSALDADENRRIFGKCNNPNGHGHNYRLEVTLRGPVDASTGMVMNLVDLKNHMEGAVLSVLDHKNIDKDVPYFKDTVSTAENIAIFIWDRLEELIPDGLLYEVKLHETDKNVAIYRGEKE